MVTPNTNSMKILVIGSEGNIGRVLCPYLRGCGHEVLRIDQTQGVGSDFVTADINAPLDIASTMANFKPQAVYLLAAMVSRVTCEIAPAITYKTNVEGVAAIAQLCRANSAKLLYFSTSEVYGNLTGALDESRTDLAPNNRYGLSKLLGEMVVRYECAQGLDATIVRPFMFYHEGETRGEHRSALVRFAEALCADGTVTVHAGAARSWMHLDDGVVVLERLLRVHCFSGAPTVINVGSPRLHTMQHAAELFCEFLELPPAAHITTSPLPERMTLVKEPALTLQKALTDFDFCTVTLKEGIRRLIIAERARKMYTK
jgi:nucleoside-diphosphate-sugar epimerase